MRVGVDATPLLGQRSGVGRYLAGLLSGLSSIDADVEPVLTLFSIRGQVPEPWPAGTVPAPRRAPARLLNKMWARVPFPPVELLTGRVDVFHATNFVLPPLARAGGVVTVHDLTYLRFPETVDEQVRAYRHLVPDALRRAERVIAVSRTIADELIAEYALVPEAVVVAPNGVGPEWGEAEPLSRERRLALGLPDRYVLFVGNREPRKNLGTLIRAHAAARRAAPEVPPLVVVGPAGWGDAWGGQQPDPEHTVLLGFLDDEDLRGTVAGASAVCVPSLYEGFGLPVVEAMAAGVRVLASDIPTHREVSGGLATLVPVQDVDAWSEVLVGLRHAEDDTGAAAAARRAHTRAFTWDRCARAHVEAYRAAATRT